MTIQELGSIGEFVAAIATLATLAYLAFQIRQNTKVARAELTKDLFLASRSALMDTAANEYLAKLSAEAYGTEDVDAIRRYSFHNSFFRLFELYFNLSQQGLLDDAIAESYEMVIRNMIKSEAGRAWWQEARQVEYHGEFAAHVDAIAAEGATVRGQEEVG